jgi:hypothetical protein
MSKKKPKIHKYISNSYRFEPPKALEVEEEQVQEYIEQIKRHLFEEGEDYAFVGTGRCIVVGMKSGKEYYIFVVRDGYEEIVFTKTK